MQADDADAVDLLVATVMVMPGEDRQHFAVFLQQGANVRCVLHGMDRFKRRIDMLTGLPNRRQLIERLQQAIMGHEGQKHQSALLMIGLDNCKTLTKDLGRAQCDQVLQQVAKRLVATVPFGNAVTCVDGYKFAVLRCLLVRDLLLTATTVACRPRRCQGAKSPWKTAQDARNFSPGHGSIQTHLLINVTHIGQRYCPHRNCIDLCARRVDSLDRC